MSNVYQISYLRAAREKNEIDILARTLWGEARGEGQSGMNAVANVVINRVRYAKSQPNCNFWWGNTIIMVCQKPLQFPCWNSQEPNFKQMKIVDESDSAFALAQRISRWACSGSLPDNTGGATNYHALNVSPQWAMGQTPVSIIGRQVFYNLAPKDERKTS
jgi:spore germination cell wall hydrolase CwlJ-like protein